LASAIVTDKAAPRLPTLHDIRSQLVRDLFGKDVQDTPTVSYAWTADQFGHLALGFEITILLSGLLTLLPFKLWPIVAPAATFTVFVLKEASDYVSARGKARDSHSDFPFDNAEILWNIVTALFYIALGIAVAGTLIVLGPWQPAVAVLILSVPALAVGVWWLKRKITFQQAGLPLMYRLAIFPNFLGTGDEEKANIAFIDALIDPRQPAGRHVVIAGPTLAGKSSLATGIGTEFAFKKGIGRYTTLIKLLQAEPVANPESDSPSEFQDGRILWPLWSADLLIVDDVDYVSDFGKRVEQGLAARYAAMMTAAVPGRAEAAPPPVLVEADPIAQIESALRNRLSQPFLDELAKRRSVWVVGDGTAAEVDAWLAMVRRVLGLTGDPDAVKLVHLKMTVREALRAKGAPVEELEKRPWVLRNLR
jgi:hypothetical protein